MGTIGNTLAFCVLIRRRMRSTPMYFYLTLLAVVDTFVLYVSAFKVWIRAVTQFEVLHLSNFGCKLLMFILLCSFYLSAWLVVLVTLDRFLVIWFPFRGYLLMRIRRARLTAAVLAVVVAAYNVHVFWTMSLHRYGSSVTCDAHEDNFFMMHIFEYLKLVSYCVVPFVIVIALNIAILVRINRVYTNAAIRRNWGNREAKVVYTNHIPLVVVEPSPPVADNINDGAVWPHRHQLALSAANSTSSTSHSQTPLNVQKLRQRRLTRMLLFISFAWLALTAPFTLHSFLPGPSYSSPSSSSATANSTTAALSESSTSAFGQLMKSADVNNSTLDGFLSHDDREVFQSTARTVFDSSLLQRTTTNSFLPKEHHTWTPSVPVSPSLPSATIHPSRYLLVKTVCFLLMYLNHAINFYLYCLTGKRFRRELAAMLDCGQVKLMCRGGGNEMVAAAAANVPVAIEMAKQNGRGDANAHQQPSGRVSLNNAHSSTSSRARSGRSVRKPEFVDERYS